VAILNPPAAQDEEKDLVAMLASKQVKACQASQVSSTQVACTNQGRVILAQGNEVKFMGQGGDMTLFSNYPCGITDKVYLNINWKDLHFLVTESDLQGLRAPLAPFFRQVAETFDGHRARVSYIDALLAVQAYLKANIRQYQRLEELSNEIIINDTVKSQSVKRVAT
jgi:hypothetical protein